MAKNQYLTQMHAARRAGKASFSYKGTTYYRAKSKTGLVVYKKTKGSAKGGSSVSGGSRSKKAGSFRSAGKLKGGAMTEQGREVSRIGRDATILARQAVNTGVNWAPKVKQLA